MDLQNIEELFPFYVLDALHKEERELVENYLKEHPEARQRLEEMRETASVLPLSVSPIEPRPRLKEALMRRVNSDAKARLLSQNKSSGPLHLIENLFRNVGFAAAVIAILWAILLSMQVSELRNQISSLNEALTAQSSSLNEIITKLPQGTQSSVITVSLKGTDVEPQAQGQLIADPRSQSAVLVITGLPPLDPGRTYQVWLIDGGAPVSAGLLSVDEGGQGVLVVTSNKAIGSFNALGISVEPNGGSLQPTGDIVVFSDL